MSDFFAHLMARSSGTAEVLRPKRSSFFEPVTPEFSTATDRLPFMQDLGTKFDGDTVLETTQQSQGETSKQDIARSSVPDELVPADKREGSTERFDKVEPPAKQRMAGAKQERRLPDIGAKYLRMDAKGQAGPELGSRVSSRREESPLFPAQTQKRAPLPTETENWARAAVPRERAADHLAFPVSDSEGFARATAKRISRWPAQNSVVTSEDQEATLGSEGVIGSTEAPVTPLFLKPLAPEQFESKLNSADTEIRDYPPSIHVTIGRVEVRASVSESPRRKEREASPVMSLEDYLKKQGNGVGR